MGFLSDWKIGKRLGACFAALCLLLASMGVLAVVELGVVNGSVGDLRDNWLPSVKISSAINTQTSDYRILELEHVASLDDAAIKRLDDKVSAQAEQVRKSSADYAKLISSDEERKVFEGFQTAWTAYLADSVKLLGHSRKNENDEAQRLLNGDSAKHFEQVATLLDRLVEINEAGANESGQRAEQTYNTARGLLIGVVLVAVLLAVAAAVMVTRSITAPLTQAIGFVEEVRDGDLRSRIEVSRRDELGQLLRAVGDMQQGLAGVVSGVRSNAESVATASAEIAQGNTDLSQRTEEQASALQQTAATMEELSATVKQNAENARQADQLAQGASSVAVQGGDVVGGLVSTMRGISDSSKRIADIIGTIDGIAFQTNILALNAAVEAARAGEQGRGFAVVAGEVRTLASRSADAAKEIKALITASVERVEQGSNQADQAGQTMQEVVAAIRRVTDIMGEISAASSEQSNGIGQVGDAIGQMDQVTQQNAALVEEAAAAAESLKTQAAALVEGVAVFKLRHG